MHLFYACTRLWARQLVGRVKSQKRGYATFTRGIFVCVLFLGSLFFFCILYSINFFYHLVSFAGMQPRRGRQTTLPFYTNRKKLLYKTTVSVSSIFAFFEYNLTLTVYKKLFSGFLFLLLLVIRLGLCSVPRYPSHDQLGRCHPLVM